MDLWDATPEAFIEALHAHGARRAYVVTQPNGQVEASHPWLASLAAAISTAPDYSGHEGAFFEVGQESGHLLSAFVHRTRRGQGAGGVRFWTYDRFGALLTDGLRLSLAMGQKCALAGLWWGGGKGVIARRPGADHQDADLRAAIYRDYGRFLTGLHGCYVAAEDVSLPRCRVLAWLRFCRPDRRAPDGIVRADLEKQALSSRLMSKDAASPMANPISVNGRRSPRQSGPIGSNGDQGC
ncbi:MAG: Glu/Leu/Phe/Val dehydrogenase dimerization domain-containing protein [Acidobacteriota bacterium]